MIRLGREDDARAGLERLVESHPGNLVFRAELAGSALRAGDTSRALALYSEGLDLHPDDRLLLRGYAAALNGAGRPHDTLKLIDEHGLLHALDAEMFRLRAEAYEKLGRSADSRLDLGRALLPFRSTRLGDPPASPRGSGPGSGLLPRRTNRGAPRGAGGGAGTTADEALTMSPANVDHGDRLRDDAEPSIRQAPFGRGTRTVQ